MRKIVDFCFVGIKSIDGVEILILMIPSPLAKFSPGILDFYWPKFSRTLVLAKS
jgi:hypothetical protein